MTSPGSQGRACLSEYVENHILAGFRLNIVALSSFRVLGATGMSQVEHLQAAQADLHMAPADPTSANRSICCGAGCGFWTLDRISEPAVMLGYCGDPLGYWCTGVLWCWGGWLFASIWMELSEIADIGYFGLSKFDASKTRLMVTTPQQSRELLSIFHLSHYVGGFLSIQCACFNFLLHVSC